MIIPTDAMRGAQGASEMADAFHPSAFGQDSHTHPAMDAIEGALLWAAGRISRADFFSVVDDCLNDRFLP